MEGGMTIDPRVLREIAIFCRQALWTLLIVPAAAIAWVVLAVLSQKYFYYVRPIVQAMSSAGGGMTTDPPSARGVLLQQIPIGTDASRALADLTGEGFGCAPKLASPGERVTCGLRAPTFIGWTSWTIELQFDESNRLAGARVEIYNVGL
jgi:hypothetical protein